MFKFPISRVQPAAAPAAGPSVLQDPARPQAPDQSEQDISRAAEPFIAPSQPLGPRPIARFVPHSGVQFVDLTLPAADLVQTQLSFTEHRYSSAGGFRTILMPLERAGSGDIIWHPVTHRALAPDQIMSVSGQMALDTFIGRWVPLPFLRYLGLDDSGQPAFDSGPENWARIFVAPPESRAADGGGAADESAYRLVLAFDTRLEAADRTGDRRYLGPNADDAALGASFRLATGATDVARFAGRPWVDGWLRRALAGQRASGSGAVPASPFEFEHVARYLALVELIGRVGAMPEIRFLDTLSRRWPVAVTSVDLLLDATVSDTAAVLVDRDAGGGAALMATATPLTLRDLAYPVRRFSGPIPTQVEFAPQPFGDAGLSRRSGRSDAFLWPSLGRIGHEAVALALGSTATEGVTGQTGLTALIGETSQTDDNWRIGVDGAGSAIGPVVSGALLAHVAEDGTPLGAAGDGRPPAIRPRFAPSALLTFFLAELVLHAISSVNATVPTVDAGRALGARRLNRIVLTLPAGMADADRERHAAHATQAVDLVWRALGWDTARDIGAPPRPEVVVGAGSDLAGQVFQLRREIATRYGDDQSALWGGSAAAAGTGAVVAASSGGPSVLRVASVEFGDQAVRAIVTDYATAGDGMLTPLQAVSDLWDDGAQSPTDALAEQFVLRAVVAALADHGHSAPNVFLSRVLDTTTVRDGAERNFARRLRAKVVRPAAAALLRIASELPPRVAGGQRIQSLRGLVARGGGRFDPYAADFDALAHRDGAATFKLDRIEIRFNQRQLDHAIRSAASAAIRRAVDLVALQGCDLVLVSGNMTALPTVADAIIAALPLEPSRIMFTSRGGSAGDRTSAAAAGDRAAITADLAPHRFAAIAGAYLAARAMPGFEAFDNVVRAVGRDLAAPMPPPPASALPAGNAEAMRLTLVAGASAAAVELAVGSDT